MSWLRRSSTYCRTDLPDFSLFPVLERPGQTPKIMARLAVAGEEGVRHVLELYRKEIDRVMALMECEACDLGPDCLSFVQATRPPHD